MSLLNHIEKNSGMPQAQIDAVLKANWADMANLQKALGIHAKHRAPEIEAKFGQGLAKHINDYRVAAGLKALT